MTTPPSLTLREKILLAACDLDSEGFDTPSLARRAHERFPEAFGLGGDGPPMVDNNKVLAKLSGDDGLCGSRFGWLEPTTKRSTYRVTRLGRRTAASLESRGDAPAAIVARTAARPPKPRRPRATPATPARPSLPAPPPPDVPPPADVDRALVRRLERCDALRKFLRGSPIIFADARQFWSLPADLSTYPGARLAAVEGALKRAWEYLSTEGAAQGDLPSLSTCYGLLNLHRLMRDRFAPELGTPLAAPAVAPVAEEGAVDA